MSFSIFRALLEPTQQVLQTVKHFELRQEIVRRDTLASFVRQLAIGFNR